MVNIIDDMDKMIECETINKFMKNNIHGSFSFQTLNSSVIINRFELSDYRDTIEYDIDSNELYVNSVVYMDNVVLGYLFSYLSEIVYKSNPNITDDISGFYFVNLNNF